MQLAIRLRRARWLIRFYRRRRLAGSVSPAQSSAGWTALGVDAGSVVDGGDSDIVTVSTRQLE